MNDQLRKTTKDSAKTDSAELARYTRAWQRLDQSLKWLWHGHLISILSGLLGIMLLFALRRNSHSLDWGGPLVFMAVLGGGGLGTVGLFRALVFRCPRCAERFFIPGDMLLWSVYTRAECRHCNLRRNSMPRRRRDRT